MFGSKPTKKDCDKKIASSKRGFRESSYTEICVENPVYVPKRD